MTTEDYIRIRADDDVSRLALSTTPEGVDLTVALTQIEGRQKALLKVPLWARTEGIRWPRRLSMEQCSSEATSLYKRLLATRLSSHEGFADLTAGMGVDFAALAPLFSQAWYVERQEELCALARHNLPLLGCSHAEVVCGDAAQWLQSRHGLLDLVMIDPARRDQAGRKVALIEDCTPDVCALQQLLRQRAHWTLIKLSPMLDITAAQRALQGIVQVHVVSVEGECKEVLLLMADDEQHWLQPDAVPVSCVNLTLADDEAVPTFTFTRREEETTYTTLADKPDEWLYEPNASILKGGAFKLVGERYGIQKLAPMSHLYTSPQFVADFPGRKWQVKRWSTFQKKDLRQMLAGLDAAELSVRGFPLSVASLRQKLKLREGGQAHLMATTLADGSKILMEVARP